MFDIKYGDKIYIIVRADLNPGQILAQSCHSAIDFVMLYPEFSGEWRTKSDHICVLEIENEEKLKELLQKAKDKNIMHSAFFESDMNNELTAIALAPSNKTRKLCYHLKLALQKT